jgi:hypothetical protein
VTAMAEEQVTATAEEQRADIKEMLWRAHLFFMMFILLFCIFSIISPPTTEKQDIMLMMMLNIGCFGTMIFLSLIMKKELTLCCNNTENNKIRRCYVIGINMIQCVLLLCGSYLLILTLYTLLNSTVGTNLSYDALSLYLLFIVCLGIYVFQFRIVIN